MNNVESLSFFVFLSLMNKILFSRKNFDKTNYKKKNNETTYSLFVRVTVFP